MAVNGSMTRVRQLPIDLDFGRLRMRTAVASIRDVHTPSWAHTHIPAFVSQ
jgi:hypothetical protein